MPCVGYGTWQTPSGEVARDSVRAALELGYRHIDTASAYENEESVGEGIRLSGVRRDEIFLTTKQWTNVRGYEPTIAAAERSLKALGMDYLDLYLIHWPAVAKGTPDWEAINAETWRGFEKLYKDGKVRAIGAYAMSGYQFHNMQLAAENNGWTIFSTLQNHYNLMYREDERELLPVARQYGVSLIPYSPLAGGHLTRTEWTSGSKRSETDFTLRGKYDAAKENDMQIIARVAEVAQKRGVTMTDVALGWLFKKGVAAPIVGATKISHFDAAVAALDFVLSDDEAAYLEEPYKAHDVVGAL